jgi:hypothetical protein
VEVSRGRQSPEFQISPKRPIRLVIAPLGAPHEQ